MQWLQNTDNKPHAIQNAIATMTRVHKWPREGICIGDAKAPNGSRFSDAELASRGLCGLYFDHKWNVKNEVEV